MRKYLDDEFEEYGILFPEDDDDDDFEQEVYEPVDETPAPGCHVLSAELAAECEHVLGYRFQSLRNLEQGLTHSSIARTRLDSNERMEFLGDAIMGAVVCEHLYLTYPDLEEGEMTRIKSAVVSRHTCAKIAQHLMLGRYILLGKGLARRDHIPGSILAGVFESVIAAIFVDGGFDAAKTFLISALSEEVTRTAKSAHAENYKSMLQQMAQKLLGHTPVYRTIDEKGPDHSKCFQIMASVGQRKFPGAWGPSKKEAEQNAAKSAIKELLEATNEVLD